MSEGGKVDSEMRQRLDQVLEWADLGDELNAAILLEKHFRDLNPIDDKTAISEPITWGEYQLFLNAQVSGQFHSSAEILTISPAQENQPVTRISWQDALWFCAWLSTQANLQSEGILHDYRLPSEEEIEQVAHQEITSSPTHPGDFLRVVRVEIPNRYQALLNYLANGRWREGDQETLKVMLEVSGQQERGFLMPDDIDIFPCEDLQIINQLWLKFSGDRFGFSIQKEIYESLGGTRKYNKDVWESFGDRIGWRKRGSWINYPDLTFNLEAPQAHLPGGLSRRFIGIGIIYHKRSDEEEYSLLFSSLVQRLVTCKI